ncbi:MAG TPA: HAD-IA family hydrolase [Chthoniobacterales bacterium]|nr:HAD-IA family hydrolase [Chthoniobacterales bacterium]
MATDIAVSYPAPLDVKSEKHDAAVAKSMRAIKTIFFDAAGTLIYLPKSVGHHYAFVGERIGLRLDAAAIDAAFATCWRETPPRRAIDSPREDDDKGWWRELVNRVLDKTTPGVDELDRDAYFEAVYGHFAEPGVWELYPEVREILEALQGRYDLAVVSNFDGRLRMILEHLGVSKFFSHIFLSSELGADKPDPEIYGRALKLSGAEANETLHVGDDPERDWAGAAAAGLHIFQLERPRNSVRDLLRSLEEHP